MKGALPRTLDLSERSSLRINVSMRSWSMKQVLKQLRAGTSRGTASAVGVSNGGDEGAAVQAVFLELSKHFDRAEDGLLAGARCEKKGKEEASRSWELTQKIFVVTPRVPNEHQSRRFATQGHVI